MTGFRGERIASTVGNEATRWGQLLMQMIGSRKDDDRLEREMKFREEEAQQRAEHMKGMQTAANERNLLDAAKEGYIKAPPQNLGLSLMKAASGALPTSPLAAGGMASMIPVARELDVKPRVGVAGEKLIYDPRSDRALQEKLAIEAAKPKPVPYDVKKDPVVIRAEYMQQKGLARNPNAPRLGTSGTTQEKPRDITKLPADVQKVAVGVPAAMASLDNYEQLTKNYMKKGWLGRAVDKAALAGEEVGALEAAQQAVLISIKDLAGLGVLNGPDMEIVTKMIGDPTSTGALMRNPKFTTARLEQARRFLDGKIEAFERTYDIKLRPDAPADEEETPPVTSPQERTRAPGGRGGGPGTREVEGDLPEAMMKLNDADLWEELVANGWDKTRATNYVRSRKK